LYIITYFWPDIRNEKGEWDLHAFEPSIKHANFNKDRIGAAEITNILNSSKCGLALSKKEGAMLAVMEYLYSGLPVVSTKSIGGRDCFLNSENSFIVKASPEAVFEGVNNLIKKDLDPNIIRQNTLNIVEKGRVDFYNLCKKLSNTTNYPDYVSFKENVWGDPNGLDKTRII
jgi:glycosyltransferase involved in cell wall biosynthesis